VKIGKGMLEFQAQNMKDVHKWGNVWAALPSMCSCGSDDIHLAFTKTQDGYEYCKVKCKKCGATYTIKQSKAGEYFLDSKEKFEKYVKQQNQSQNQTNIQNNFDGEIVDNEDIPF
jgi:hypothetical protein